MSRKPKQVNHEMPGQDRPDPGSTDADHPPRQREPDYEVGYGRPPKHTRFKPGQSGNPAGRTPKSRNLKTILKQVLEESVEISIRGRLRRVPGIEALVRNTFIRSFKNDAKSFAMLVAMIKQTGYGEEATGAANGTLEGEEYDAIVEAFLGRFGISAGNVGPSAGDGRDPEKPDEGA